MTKKIEKRFFIGICPIVFAVLIVIKSDNKYFITVSVENGNKYFLLVLLFTLLLRCPAVGKRTFVAPHGQLVLSTSASTPEPSITSSPITFTNVNTKVRIQVQIETQMCKQTQSVSRPISQTSNIYN